MLLDSVKYILLGIATTLAVSGVALPIGLVFGLSFALLRVYGARWLGWLVNAYSAVMRGVPPIVMLFLLYFVISGAISLTPFWAGSLALGIISSGYQLEIARGALLSVGEGQMIAARALGMSRVQAIRHIVLPQALRLAIPSWSNEVANLIKDSSLVYALGVLEVLQRAQFVSASTKKPFIALATAAIVYFVLVFIANRFLDYVEQRTKIPGHVG